MIKYIAYFLISFFLVFIQQSLFSGFSLLADLNILLITIVYITLVFGFNLGFIFALFIGFGIGLYTFLPFGVLLLIFLAIVFLIDLVNKYILTSFSFFTNFILIIGATISYYILIIVFSNLFFYLKILEVNLNLDQRFLDGFFNQLFLNTLLMIFLYLISKITFKRLNLAFLIQNE